MVQKVMTPEERRVRYHALRELPLTPEEKAHWEPMLHATWQAIGPDAEQAMRDSKQKLTKGILVEFVVDANRVQEYGGMTDEEYEFLCIASSRPTVWRWLSKTLNY